MDDQKPANEGNEQGLNKIDLAQLQDFTFGTQWTEIKQVSPQRREREGDRGERRDDRGPGGEPKRDRRTFRKPAPAPGAPAPAGGGEPGAAPRPFQGDRGYGHDNRPQGEGYRGGPRRDFRGGGEGYRGGGGGDWRERGEGAQFERGPYISPYFNITCYPEDAGFAAMVKAVRASCRTFQLFEITKAVLEKNERFVVVIQRKPEGAPRAPESAPAAGESAEGKPAEAPRAAKLAPLFMSVPDHLPFETEEAAFQHVLKNHLGLFFDSQEVEIDAPKGNFPIINKCGITGELLGPPNHHRYQQVLQQHHATRLSRMSFDRFRDSIVSVREPEVVQQWMDKMKKATRYTWKTAPAKLPVDSIPPFSGEAPAGKEAVPAPELAPEKTDAAPVAEAPAETPATPPAAPAAPAVEPGPSFDSLDEARAYLLANAKEKVVRAVETVRFHGKLIEKLPPGEAKRAIEGHVERQRRFPLDTANALRGRLRREGFTIFKKGSRGVSYVCAVKRRFRVPGQVFSESITGLIDFIEKNPMVPVKDLPLKFLAIDLAAAVAANPVPEGTAQSQAPFAVLPPEQSERLRKMNNDLRWLVTEGYVTEFSDSKLFAPPAVVAQALRKSEEHGEEHDPVDFPEAPPATPTPAAAAVSAEASPGAAPSAPAVEAPVDAAPESAPVPEAPVEAAPTIPLASEPAPSAEPPAPAPAAPAEPEIPA